MVVLVCRLYLKNNGHRRIEALFPSGACTGPVVTHRAYALVDASAGICGRVRAGTGGCGRVLSALKRDAGACMLAP